MKAKKFCRYRYIIYFASLKPDTQKVFLSETSRISPVFHGQFKLQCPVFSSTSHQNDGYDDLIPPRKYFALTPCV